jgi:hypothetical protein
MDRVRSSLAVLVVLGVATLGTSHVGAALPDPPRVWLDTTYPALTGRTISVPAGGDLQAALDAAAPGDAIVLQAGATYTGAFVLPNKSGSGWIVVRSSAEASLPPPGTRVTPASRAAMAAIVGVPGAPALSTAPGAHHFRFVGIEFRPAPGTYTYGLIRLGSHEATSAAQQPHDIVFDRCYIHGDPVTGGKRGVEVNGARIAIVDSHLSEWKGFGQEAQAIGGWNGPGPFKFVNNRIEAAGENILFGGADPRIPNLVPSDIEVRGNLFTKPLAWNHHDSRTWDGRSRPTVKNIFELKSAQRVLIDGNVFEHNWVDAQAGTAILFTPRNQEGGAPWTIVADVTFTNNIVRHAASGLVILGHDYLYPSRQTQRILIRNVLFEDIGGARWGGGGRLFEFYDGSRDVVIEHVTAFHTGNVVTANGPAHTGFVFRNVIAPHNAYGVIGTGTAVGTGTLTAYFPGAQFARNVLAGGPAWVYPADNSFPLTLDGVGFVNRAGGDYRLADWSPFKRLATDGSDPGVDVDALEAALGGGAPTPVPPAPPPPPPPAADTIPPAVTITQPRTGAVVGGTVTIAARATDDVGVSSVRFAIDGSAIAGASPISPVAVWDVNFAWTSTSVPDGHHTITVAADDAAGNTASTSITVIVDNEAPAVEIVSPATGASIRKRTDITVRATDAVRLVSIHVFANDGLIGTIGCNGTTCTGRVAWKPKRITSGAHTIRAVATDGAGKTSTATIIVYN